MTTVRKFATLVTFVAALGVSSPLLAASAADSEPADEQLVHNLLDSMMDYDYQRFISYVTPEFGDIAARDFGRISTQIGPRLEKGYEVEYFGMLHQLGYDISVWKISFSDNYGDVLATLNVQDGKARAFFMQ